MANILVTGGDGFLGSYVVEELLKDHDNHVTVLSNTPKKKKRHDAGFIDCDIRNKNGLLDKIKDFDIVYHIAGNIRTSKTDDKQLHYGINAIGTRNMLEACSRNGIKRFVFISTCEVYGNIRKEHIGEDEKIKPENDYARSKAQAEIYCGKCAKLKKMKVTIIRPSYIYGYGQSPERLFPKLIASALEKGGKINDNKKLGLSPDSGGYDFVYVKDAAKGIALLGQNGQEKHLEVYNISSGKFTSTKEVFDAVKELTGYKYNGYQQASSSKVNEKYSLLIEKAKKKGYAQKYSLRGGIADFIERYKMERGQAEDKRIKGWKIPLFRIYSDKKDIDAVSKVIKRGSSWAEGPEIRLFEKKMGSYIGSRFALAFNSGTSALHSLLLAHDVKGKDVIVPSFTFISTANAILLAGGKPKFAELEPETFGLDAEDVKKRINGSTKAIIAMHYMGFPSKDIGELRKIADDYNILLIEDAAEALGASINGKKAGTFGDSAIFSFCQNKVITTGEGGLMITKAEEIYRKCRLIRSHGRAETGEDYFSSVGNEDYVEIGYNYRMPTVLASLGISQLDKIEKIIGKRRKIVEFLDKSISKFDEITTPKKIKGHYQIYQMYPILLENEKIRNELQKYLVKKRIMSKVYFNPVHLKTVYREKYGYKRGDLPKTESISKRVLALPIYPDLSNKDMEYIASSINDFFNSKGGQI